MIISLQALKQYINITTHLFQEVTQDLYKLGFEVSRIIDNSNNKNIVVGQVTSAIQHPRSTKLWVCDVLIGAFKSVKIVCGSKAVLHNPNVIVALPGAKLPTGVKIIPRTILGIASNGMICAKSELDWINNSVSLIKDEDIHIVSNDTRCFPGKSGLAELGFADIIVECEVPTNMHNESGIIHVARKIAAEYQLKVYDYTQIITRKADANNFKITNCAPQICENVAWVVIKNVDIPQSSPTWIQKILHIYQIKCISPLVDLTNLVMLELNQPLHAYDLQELAGDNEILFSKWTSNMPTRANFINNPNINCKDRYLAISKKKQHILGLIGITGADYTSISANTREIVVEATCVNAYQVRQEIKKVGISTQAATMFSKPLHPNKILFALNRFISLGVKLKYFSWYSEIKFASMLDLNKKKYKLSLSEVNHQIGIILSKNEVTQILEKQFQLHWINNDDFMIEVPEDRLDIDNKNAITEQLLKTRHIWDRVVHAQLCDFKMPNICFSSQVNEVNVTTQIKGALRLTKYSEEHLFSLTRVDKYEGHCFGLNDERPIILKNPLSEKYAQYRTKLFVDLITVVINSWNRNITQVNLFEVNEVYYLDNDSNFVKKKHLCLIHGSPTSNWHRYFSKLNYSLFCLWNHFTDAVNSCGFSTINLKVMRSKKPSKWINANNHFDIFYENALIGFVGEIDVAMLIDAKRVQHLFVLEVDLGYLEALRCKIKRNVTQFPSEPSTSKLQEHNLTFLFREGVYHLQMPIICSKVINSFPELVDIKIIDLFKMKKNNTSTDAITIKLWLDFANQKPSKEAIETVLWAIKARCETLIDAENH